MGKRIIIDPGHAPGNANAGKNGYKEYEGMWKLSCFLKAALERCGYVVGLTRDENENPTLLERGKKAAGCDLFISEHSNASNGTARGAEVYYSLKLREDKPLASDMSKAVAMLMDNPDRGAKTRESTIEAGSDYYTVIYSAQAAGAAHVLLAESGFHDNAIDEAFLLDNENLMAIAETQAQVICRYLDCEYIPAGEKSGTAILSVPTASISQMKNWAINKNATTLFVELANTFYEIAKASGVNPVVAYCQSAKETAYGRFGGVVDESYCNPCGMKTTLGGDDIDKTAHKRFADWDEGIQAQTDHLALYAGAAGYPKSDTPDPRDFPYLYGTAETVEQLGGKWARSETYGNEITAMMRAVENTEAALDDINEAKGSRTPDDSEITIFIESNTCSIAAELINDHWYITVGGAKVKVRDIFEAFGYCLEWDNENRTVTADKGYTPIIY